MLRVLGPAAVGDGPPTAGRAQRVLLSALALDRPRGVAADRLVDLLWGARPPAHPPAALHSHVSRLRRSLPAGAGLVAAGDGYLLHVDDDELDVCRFSVAPARTADRDPAEVLGEVEDALRLWRGEPYVDLEGDDRARAEAVRLTGLRLVLLERRAEGLVATGRAAEAVAELEALHVQDPLRERTVELLMRAYVAAGRRSDALQAYARLRAATVAELGLDPSPALRDLQSDVAADRLPGRVASPVVARGAVATGPRRPSPAAEDGRTSVPAPRGIPHPASRLVGRQRDLDAARAALTGRRLLTVVGPGGVGKTRLALRLVRDLGEDDDGGTPGAGPLQATFVELAHLRDADGLADLLASTLGTRHGSEGSPVDRVVRALSTGRHLLLVDNCEHVVEAAARLVDTVLRSTSGTTVVATSREPLDVDGEQVLRLEPLPPADAVELFVDRARAADPRFVVDGRTAPLVAELCRSLDGLPLALELAAARTATHSLEELLAGLGERYRLLDGGRRTAAARHRSLRALVDWSVRDLDDRLRRVFTRLSVFAGPTTVANAAEVCDETVPVTADCLARLSERSLLVVHREPGAPTRYGFLQTVRACAAEELAVSGDADEVRDRHARMVLGVVAAAEHGTTLSDPTDGALERLAEVRVAHRHLLATGDGDAALRLAAGLHHLALFRMQSEVFGWVAETAERFGDLDHPDAERVLASACIGAWQSGDLAAAHVLADRAVAAGARSRRPGAGAAGAAAMADVVGFEGDLERSLALWRTAVERGRSLGRSARRVLDLADLATVASYLRHDDEAAAAVAEARALLDPQPSWVTAWLDYAEGEALAEREPERALHLLARAMTTARATSADFISGVAGLTWAGLQVRVGEDPDRAVPVLVDLLERWRRSGAWVQLSISLRTVVELLAGRGDVTGAATVLGALRTWTPGGDGTLPGPDGRRLRAVLDRLHDERDDVDGLMDAGAALSRDEVVGLVLVRLAATAPRT